MNEKFYASSKKDDWETPPALMDRIQKIIGGVLFFDAASTEQNKKTMMRLNDGLADEWPDYTFCNPPYGRLYSAFLDKALRSRFRAVLLIKSNTETKSFQKLLRSKCTQFWFIPGRIKFMSDGAASENTATFPSCVVFINFGREIQGGNRVVIEKENEK